MMLREQVHATMRALVQRYGSLDAVAAMIGARYGAAPSKATLSKKMTGALDWTMADIVAIEDALGAWPVTTLINDRRLEPEVASGCLMAHSAVMAKEAGEATAALLRALASGEAVDLAQARVEIVEGIAAMSEALDRVDRLSRDRESDDRGFAA